MRVAVSAVSGQLGGAIAQKLIHEIGRENVVGTARNPSKAEHLGIKVKPGDYNSRSDFEEAYLEFHPILKLLQAEHIRDGTNISIL
ncbi:MAG: hypothetical protein GY790_05095 [Bacteroidetes bacterium]|nr:hypothetical protein [Bacteroidota bacterium]